LIILVCKDFNHKFLTTIYSDFNSVDNLTIQNGAPYIDNGDSRVKPARNMNVHVKMVNNVRYMYGVVG